MSEAIKSQADKVFRIVGVARLLISIYSVNFALENKHIVSASLSHE